MVDTHMRLCWQCFEVSVHAFRSLQLECPNLLIFGAQGSSRQYRTGVVTQSQNSQGSPLELFQNQARGCCLDHSELLFQLDGFPLDQLGLVSNLGLFEGLLSGEDAFCMSRKVAVEKFEQQVFLFTPSVQGTFWPRL